MLQHSQISPADYSSYPPSRDSRQDSVKLESSDTPDLGAPISNQQPPFHFGSDPAFNYSFMSTQQWKPSIRSQLDATHPFESTNSSSRVEFDLPLLDSGSHGTQDDSYDDLDVDGFGDSQQTPSTPRSAGSSDKPGERHIRRRSSKGTSQLSSPLDFVDALSLTACDQCRKLKCKCERTGLNIPCRNCVTLNAGQYIASSALRFVRLLGTSECTFLGPSRKRGPPKGYINAIEARLHQTEAVLGIILSLAGGLDGSRGNGDPGASSLIEDLCQVRGLSSNQMTLKLC